MPLKQMIQQIENLGIVEKRSVNDDYCEVVFRSAQTEQVNQILMALLGPATKPPGNAPTAHDETLTAPTGGIRPNQTLYEKKIGTAIVIAKLWPWGDGVHTTLKTALLK
jgi:hypothetical protein